MNVILTKVCTKCGEKKSLEDFHRGNSSYGKKSRCKVCRSISRKVKFAKSPEKELAINREWYRRNKEKRSAQIKRYQEENKEEKKARNKRWYENNKEDIRARGREYYHRTKEEKAPLKKRYREANKEKRRLYVKNRRPIINVRNRERRRTDPAFKLSLLLRGKITKAIKRGSKVGSAVRDLGCSIKDLKLYLERQFYPHPKTGEEMTWDNWSLMGWNIDHIIPVHSVDLLKRDQFLKVCHYTNLQPLWHEDHVKKTIEDGSYSMKGRLSYGS